ncbi:calcineurin-like phosphoesterase family protein [Fulvivirga sp. M361]|uniref:calcineurin-like phosphoesterase C-terminal domain-containing protein n=1 Tax=Fulvivirga sp. M361 TaxID=2594266 RepID=UPI00162AA897|nr:calcineurin-like phosphoesterase family protein [Fulvivirga sp. M361]
MKTQSFCYVFLLAAFSFTNSQSQTTSITGTIYLDINKNNTYDTGEEPLQDVLVSNGRDIVISTAEGRYTIEVNHGQTIFVIKPSGFSLPLDEFGIPNAYFHYYPDKMVPAEYPGLSITHEVPKNVNFGLKKSPESDTFKVAMLGDLQMRNQEEINYANRLLTPELYKRDDLSMAVLLGDIADDNLNILNGMRQITKHFKMASYPVFGNHDRNLEKPWRYNFTSTFKKIFGPDYYSANYGKVHFIMLNDILPTEKGYTGGITEDQLTFIENDLKHVPEDYLIVFNQHIPIYSLDNRKDLLELIKNREHVLAVSGHRHILEQEFIPYADGKELHEVVAGAVCGLWWDGERDWKGIPVAVMGGGAPKGYYVFTFTGNQYQMAYKALELPPEKQINLWTWQPDRGDPGMQLPNGFKGNEVLANVFAGSVRTEVSMCVDDGKWVPMQKADLQDPYIARILYYEKKGTYPTPGQIRSGLRKEPSRHLWIGSYPEGLSSGSHKVEIMAKDPYGLNAYEVSFFILGKFD